jgi:hypothetical protein
LGVAAKPCTGTEGEEDPGPECFVGIALGSIEQRAIQKEVNRCSVSLLELSRCNVKGERGVIVQNSFEWVWPRRLPRSVGRPRREKGIRRLTGYRDVCDRVERLSRSGIVGSHGTPVSLVGKCVCPVVLRVASAREARDEDDDNCSRFSKRGRTRRGHPFEPPIVYPNWVMAV